MNQNPRDYTLYYKFLETYGPVGFKGINPEDLLIRELERMTEINNQFFYAGDLLQMHIIYTSSQSKQMIGVEAADLSPYQFFDITHPEDIQRLSQGRAKLFKMAHDLYSAQKGCSLLSTNFRMRNPQGSYSCYLIQIYMYFSEIPYKSVYLLKVHTKVDWCKKLRKGFHYYVGDDLSNFRYPDEELLGLSLPFSDRELEIIKLISSGLSSKEIADKIFLSVNTVNTHRRNILIKSGKESLPALIYDLMEKEVI
ncbi:MAG: LuxR C-terminal-related transcriptional regulator [Bacteroidetes bacterium]|nr:LuxR C-terminal-related transcriptional regulator [Bacteroidota bacterium]